MCLEGMPPQLKQARRPLLMMNTAADTARSEVDNYMIRNNLARRSPGVRQARSLVALGLDTSGGDLYRAAVGGFPSVAMPFDAVAVGDGNAGVVVCQPRPRSRRSSIPWRRRRPSTRIADELRSSPLLGWRHRVGSAPYPSIDRLRSARSLAQSFDMDFIIGFMSTDITLATVVSGSPRKLITTSVPAPSGSKRSSLR